MEHDPDTPALLARVRWGNVAKAVALAAVVVLIAAWPRLRAPDPQIPPGAAVPVRQAPEETATTAVPEPVAKEPDAAAKRRDRPHRKPRSRKRKAPERQRQEATPVPPRPAPTWRGRARMGAEFSVE